MSVSLNSHFGYYLVAKAKTYESERAAGKQCKNNHPSDKGNFCAHCGEPLTLRFVPVEATRDMYDIDVDNEVTIFGETYTIDELICELASKKNITILYFTFDIDGVIFELPDVTYDSDDCTHVVDRGAVIELECFKHWREVEKELKDSGLIDFLEEAYEDIQLKFGVVAFYS